MKIYFQYTNYASSRRGLLRWYGLPAKEGQRISKFVESGLKMFNAFDVENMTQGSSRERYVLCLTLLKPCTDLSWSIVLLRRRGLYVGTYPNLLIRDKAYTLVLSDWWSGVLQSLDLSSLPDMWNIAYSGGCLYIFLIYCLINIDVSVLHFDDLSFGRLLFFGLYKEDYLQISKCVSFWLHSFCG